MLGTKTGLFTGEMGDEEWARVASAMKDILAWNNRLIIDDTSYQTPATLRARTRRYVRSVKGRPAGVKEKTAISGVAFAIRTVTGSLQASEKSRRGTGAKRVPQGRKCLSSSN
jgi:hypothetical protein